MPHHLLNSVSLVAVAVPMDSPLKGLGVLLNEPLCVETTMVGMTALFKRNFQPSTHNW